MCCFKKMFLFVLNIVVFGVGVTVITLASIVIAENSEYGDLLSDGVFTIPVITLILGIIITLFGFFGCFGALRENRCMLYTYGIVTLCLLIGEIVLGIFILVDPDAIKEKTGDVMIKQFSKYTNGDQEDEALNNLIDQTQEELQCCGVNDFNDWYEDDDFLWNDEILPQSCCVNQAYPCTAAFGTPVNTYEEGCLDAFGDELHDISLALGISAIILSFVLLFSTFTACGIARRRGREKRRDSV